MKTASSFTVGSTAKLTENNKTTMKWKNTFSEKMPKVDCTDMKNR